MNISISSFKGINKLESFPIKRVNVLTGANSGGKSSLIHLLLLLKQSIEAASFESALKLNKPYVSLGKFESILYNEKNSNTFSVTFHLDNTDIGSNSKLLDKYLGTIEEKGQFKQIDVYFSFKKATKRIVVKQYKISIFYNGYVENKYLDIERNIRGNKYAIKTNAPFLFLKKPLFSNIVNEGDYREMTANVLFSSFFPYEIENSSVEVMFGPFNRVIRNIIYRFFNGVTYIGPLREEPREYYFQDDDFVDSIGNKGENAAFIYANYSQEVISTYKYSITRGELEDKVVNITLENALNHWLCEIFEMAKTIRVDRAKTNRHIHTVTLTNNNGKKIPITHVGFGISQVLPIIVEGLRPSQNTSLIILEQPEIHLHPKVQSLLFDFLSSISLNKSVLVETHSDHFIHRLRRRVAEDKQCNLLNKIVLTFVNNQVDGTEYDVIKLEENGTIKKWPSGFFDQYDNEFKLLIKAQSKKNRI
ncbi:MAG: DUF3696 domain-containing protein [Nitrospirota bacterium]